METKRFGRKIKEKRKEHGLTSEELADKCFINEGYVRQLESGKKIPSMPLLIRMCEDKYSTMEYSIILMDAASGPIYPLTKDLYLELTPYKISTSTQEDSQLIRLYFEKTE